MGVGRTAEEVGLTLAEGKELLGGLARLILQTQREGYCQLGAVEGNRGDLVMTATRAKERECQEFRMGGGLNIRQP